MFEVREGDVLHGEVDYLAHKHAYLVSQTSTKTGKSSQMLVPIQHNRNYTVVYFVQEKECECDQYSPSGRVTFFDIEVEFNHKPVVPHYKLSYVDDVCNARAHVINSTAIDITWNTH